MKQSIKQNLILVIMTVMTLMLAFFIGLGITMPSVVALEQDARCGITEHVHRDDCYLNNVLICGEKAHTHGENCYLLRLEDNDINRLLSEIEADEEKSLEHVITNVVYEASYLELVSEGLLPAPTPTPTPTPTPLISLLPAGSSLDSLTATNEGVANLNRSIVDNNITPTIYLNERLITPASEGGTVTPDKNLVNLIEGETSPTDLSTYAVDNNGGISLLAVNGNEGSNNANSLNIYVQVDNDWEFVQTETFSVQSQGNGNTWWQGSYIAYIAQNTVANAVKNKLGISQLTENILTARYASYGSTNAGASNAGTGTYNNTTAYTLGTYEWNYWGTDQSTAQNNANSAKNLFVGSFYTVTINYIGGTPVKQYVQSGQNSTLPIDTATYEYSTSSTFNSIIADNQVSSRLNNITATTTLYARPKEMTVRFYAEDGETLVQDPITAKPGSNGKLSVTLPARENALWIIKDSDGSEYWLANGNIVLELSVSTDFKAVPSFYEVTYIDEEGSESVTKVAYSGKATLPDLPAGWLWQNGENYYSVGEKVPISSNTTFTAVEGCRVTFVYANGTVEERIVKLNTRVTLPGLSSGYYWYDEEGNRVTSAFNATGDITLYAGKPLTLKYTVDPNGTVNALADSANGATIKPSKPTISGSSGTTLSEEVLPGANMVLRNATPNKLTAIVSGTNGTTHNYHVVGYFVGWRVGNTNTILSPNANYTYDDLAQYADSNGNITLNGVWEEGWNHTANFFIKFNSVLDGTTAAEAYTPSVFTTYVGYASGYNPSGVLEGSSDKNMTDAAAIAADLEIRARLGSNDKNGADSVYLYDMPTDDQVFAALKEYVHSKGDDSELEVEGVKVDVDDLTSETFAIRWYVFKYQDGTGWHIDGRLVRKEGNIVVHKTFEGREDYVTAAQNGFTITANSGTIVNGNFVDNSSKANITLVTSRAANSSDTTTIGYTTKTEPVIGANGMLHIEYTWVIPKVGAGEYWHIEEQLQPVKNSLGLGEWVIVDSSNDQSSQGTGTKTVVEGVTFPKDVSSDEWLRAEFTNVYYSENSIMLRKIDASTRSRLDGAEFQLWQSTPTGDKLMTFDLVETVINGTPYNSYVYNENGTGKETNIKSDGTEINISVEHFSYELGPIHVREVKAPAGYVAGDEEIVIGYNKLANGNYEKDDATGNYVIKLLSDTNYATFDKGLLTIENVPQSMNVEVVKEWRNCYQDEWADTVTVQLMALDAATGKYSANLAASVLPDGVSTIQNLSIQKDSGGNITGYSSYTWKNLPEYINGSKAEWTVKELAIGSEEIKADGTFPNWNSYVSLPTETIKDGVKTAAITVTNNPKAGTELRLIKKDNFNKPIPGVTFELRQGSKVLNTLTTDANGEIIFHNLKYGIQYTLVEDEIPVGYWGYDDPIKVTINEDGTITISADSPPNAKPSAQNYTIEVINYTGEPLPETGGVGTHIYTAGGLLLMAAATALLIYRRKRRKEADLLDV